MGEEHKMYEFFLCHSFWNATCVTKDKNLAATVWNKLVAHAGSAIEAKRINVRYRRLLLYVEEYFAYMDRALAEQNLDSRGRLLDTAYRYWDASVKISGSPRLSLIPVMYYSLPYLLSNTYEEIAAVPTIRTLMGASTQEPVHTGSP